MVSNECKLLVKAQQGKLTLTNQTIVAIEELAELQKELTKCLRGKKRREGLAEELSHAYFMIEQMIILYGLEDDVKVEYKNAQFRMINLLTEKSLIKDIECEELRRRPKLQF